MPNHVANIIRAKPHVLARILDPENRVDFELILPMPEGIHRGGHTRGEHYPNGSWYDWCPKNWGTKWNAYGQNGGQKNPSELRFDTAWNPPQPVIEALSKEFPDEEIRVAYADEDTGYNLGVYAMRNGQIVREHPLTEGSLEAENLACLICHGMTSKQWSDEWGCEPEERAGELDEHFDPFDLIKDPADD